MAGIPIIDVPNAPQGVGPPQLTEYPNVQAVNLRPVKGFESRAAELERPMIRQGSFDAPAEGLRQIGRSITYAGGAVADAISGPIQKYQEKLQLSKDMADVSHAANIMTDTRGLYDAEVAQNPGADRVALWRDKYAPLATQQLKAMQPSVWTSERIVSDWGRFQSHTLAEARVGMANHFRDVNGDAILAEMNNALASEDGAKFIDANNRYTAAGYQTPEQAQFREKQFGDKVHEKVVIRDINADPHMVATEFEEAKKSGKSDVYPWLDGHPAQIAHFADIARRQANSIENDANDDIATGIAAGEIITHDQLKSAANGRLPETKLKAWNNKLDQILIKEPELNTEVIADIRSRIQTYDPAADPAFEQRHAIRTDILEKVPKDLRDDLTKELKDKIEPKETAQNLPPWWGSFERQTWEMTRKGLLFAEPTSRWGLGALAQGIGILGPKVGQPFDKLQTPAEREKVWTKEQQAINTLREWAKAHPDEAQDPAKAIAKFSEITGPDANRSAIDKMAAPDQMPKPWVPPASMEGPVMPTDRPPGPQEMQRLMQMYKPQEWRTKPTSSAITPSGDSFVSTIKEFEGFYPKAYWDNGQWSIGYGTRASGPGETITRAEADARLKQELAMHARRIDDTARQMGITLPDGMRDALISFDFNTGRGTYLLTSSGGNPEEIKRRMLLYTKSDGQEYAGLADRRRAEVAWF